MIQRIQTIYLALAVIALGLCLFFPIATYVAPIQSTQQTLSARLDVFPHAISTSDAALGDVQETIVSPQRGFIKTWPLVVILFATMALSATCIFLYHNRVLQMRLVAVASLFGIIYIFLIFVWAVDAFAKAFAVPFGADNPVITYSFGTWAPIAAIALLILAQRAIRKDEMKVRAADRLR